MSYITSPSTATGTGSMVKVQVRVDEQDPPQFSRLATLAGVTPPMTDAEIQQSERRKIRSQSKKERTSSKLEVISKKDGYYLLETIKLFVSLKSSFQMGVGSNLGFP